MKTNSTSAASIEIDVHFWKTTVQELTELLQQQLNLARRGRIEQVEAMVGQSDPLVKRLSEAQILERSEFRTEKQSIEMLYKQIYSALADRHEGISNELQSIRKGRKLVKAYRGGI